MSSPPSDPEARLAALNAVATSADMLASLREDTAALRTVAARHSVKPDDERDIREIAAHLDSIALWLSSRAITEAVDRKRGARS
jgi:hypothetical protein